MMTVAISTEVERQRQRLLVVRRRPRYRLPQAIPQGPDFNLEMFNDAWALGFLRYYRSGIRVDVTSQEADSGQSILRFSFLTFNCIQLSTATHLNAAPKQPLCSLQSLNPYCDTRCMVHMLKNTPVVIPCARVINLRALSVDSRTSERCYLIFICSRYKRAHTTSSCGA